MITADLSGTHIVVLGGFVMDCIVAVDDLPNWGEAVQAQSMRLTPGGKGFNQAVACARLGVRTSVIGAIGADEFGERILNEFKSLNIDFTGVSLSEGVGTSMTLVFVRPDGQASFIGWKNEHNVVVDKNTVFRAERTIRDASAILITFEVSLEAVTAAIEIAKKHSVKVFVNPAPPIERPDRPADLPLDKVDYLIPNEWEARLLRYGGRRKESRESTESVEDVANFLGAHLEIPFVCITRAHEPCVVWSRGVAQSYDSLDVEIVDSTGGSDAFCAALAAYLCAGIPQDEAMQVAHAAGSLAVGKSGGSESMPTRPHLDNQVRIFRGRKSSRG